MDRLLGLGPRLAAAIRLMITAKIAGHNFVNGVCVGLPHSPSCGRRWEEIWHVTRDDIGKRGLAHVEGLNSMECEEIMAAKAEQDRRCGAALVF